MPLEREDTARETQHLVTSRLGNPEIRVGFHRNFLFGRVLFSAIFTVADEDGKGWIGEAEEEGVEPPMGKNRLERTDVADEEMVGDGDEVDEAEDVVEVDTVSVAEVPEAAAEPFPILFHCRMSRLA